MTNEALGSFLHATSHPTRLFSSFLHTFQSSFPRTRESRVVAFSFFWMPDRGPA